MDYSFKYLFQIYNGVNYLKLSIQKTQMEKLHNLENALFFQNSRFLYVFVNLRNRNSAVPQGGCHVALSYL